MFRLFRSAHASLPCKDVLNVPGCVGCVLTWS